MNRNNQPDNLQESARELGGHLARLLAASTLSDEQKQAWAVLVPEMTMDQMVRFGGVLEKYVNHQTLPELVALRAKLEGIKRDYDANVVTLSAQTQTQLHDVMAQVKAAEIQG